MSDSTHPQSNYHSGSPQHSGVDLIEYPCISDLCERLHGLATMNCAFRNGWCEAVSVHPDPGCSDEALHALLAGGCRITEGTQLLDDAGQISGGWLIGNAGAARLVFHYRPAHDMESACDRQGWSFRTAVES